ncbi:MAG: NlpC/P60 family protein [Solirubrobacteraceae bacterium]|nr:NlpC/P60 family protein [Solirubrobacteraceae bacterium]
MRRFLLLISLLCCAPAATAAASAGSASTWDVPQQHAVMRAGLLSTMSDGKFHGDQPLTGHQLSAAFAVLGTQLSLPAIDVPSGPMTVVAFDRLMVRRLGLSDVADTVHHAAWHAGLQPPSYFGTEVIARALGLRFDHPFPAGEAIELYPSDDITRAEAAWSLAVVLRFSGWEVDGTRSAFSAFTLPTYTDRQRAALRVAVSKIGMPYIWGGETDGPSYGQVHGGYDCSGYVWRVFKETGLVHTIYGRTAAQMAGEIPKSQRVRWTKLRPADLMFFGSAHFTSRATESDIVHTAIVLGNGWLINSSDQGVFVQPMEGWRQSEFAWGRHVL